jgi:lipopolysaccharide export system permease protein
VETETTWHTFLVTVMLVADLWWPRLLQLFNYTLGLVMVGAMGFTFSQLVRGRELVAVLASGLPLRRVARPVLVVSLALTALQILNQELVIPRIAPLLTRDHGDAGKRALTAGRINLTPDSANRIWYAASFDPENATLRDVTVWERDQSGLATRVISAASAVWNAGGWDLSGGRAESRTSLAQIDGGKLPTPEEIRRLETDLDPTSLTMKRYESYRQSLSWRQIWRLLDRGDLKEDRRAPLERIAWGRVSIMVSNILGLVIAMPFFLRREPCNMVLQSLKGAPVAILALMGGVLGASAAIPGVPAPLGVFIPVLVLAPIAVASATGVKS